MKLWNRKLYNWRSGNRFIQKNKNYNSLFSNKMADK
jgi:hypothetical protein